MITVQFANGKVFQAESIDDAIAQCLASGNDPFNPTIIQDKIEQNANTEQQ